MASVFDQLKVYGIDPDDLLQSIEDRHANSPDALPYTAVSDEPLMWDRSGVIKLSIVVTAVHFMAARIALLRFNDIVQTRIEQTLKTTDTFVENQVVTRILSWAGGGKFVKLIGSLLGTLSGIWDEAKLQKAKEIAIRDESLLVRRNILKLKLFQGQRGPRIRRSVHSRHQTKKQRRANKTR